EKDAANSSFNECLAQYQAGKVAMWYDATVAAGLLEAKDSPVKGKNGYALAPVVKTKASGWLWSWALAIPKSSPDPTDAWKYIAWATGPSYIKAAGTKTKGGWAAIPPGTRLSTYRIPQYKQAAAAFASKTVDAALRGKGKVGDPFSSPWRRRLPLLPALLFAIAITQLPFLVSIYYSFTNLKDRTQSLIPEPTKFVGIDNYKAIFNDPFFRQA